MYFGALAIGADICGGFLAYYLINKKNYPISLIFKDFHANFLKRAEEDVIFTCNQVKDIQNLVENTHNSEERQFLTLNILAYPVSELNHDPVADFKLTLSLKTKHKTSIKK
mgnify:CR=1 FL=1